MTRREVVEGSFVETRDWPYVGVYIYNESVDTIVAKLEYAYRENYPVYFRYSDWDETARKLHNILIFMSNIGYVFIHSATVNKKQIPGNYVCLKLVDYKENINMSRWGQWSPAATRYYDTLVEKGAIAKNSWAKTFDYEYPDINENAHWKVKEL